LTHLRELSPLLFGQDVGQLCVDGLLQFRDGLLLVVGQRQPFLDRRRQDGARPKASHSSASPRSPTRTASASWAEAATGTEAVGRASARAAEAGAAAGELITAALARRLALVQGGQLVLRQRSVAILVGAREQSVEAGVREFRLRQLAVLIGIVRGEFRDERFHRPGRAPPARTVARPTPARPATGAPGRGGTIAVTGVRLRWRIRVSRIGGKRATASHRRGQHHCRQEQGA
jgi:hypothetical protein